MLLCNKKPVSVDLHNSVVNEINAEATMALIFPKKCRVRI